MRDFLTPDFGAGFEAWEVVDPRPLVEAYPYTFFVPLTEDIEALQKGDLVKLIFDGDAPAAERMWVSIESQDASGYTGRLDNTPRALPGLKLGQSIRFEAHHIIAIWEPRVSSLADHAERTSQAFATCYADPRILDSGAVIARMERRAPDADVYSAYGDTGWHFFAATSREADLKPVGIGEVLNCNDAILPYLDAPLGQTLRRSGPGFHGA